MADVTLRAETGRQPGSRESRRIRRAGNVPAVVYGRGMDPISVTVDAHDLDVALHTEAGHNVLLTLELDSGESVLTLPKQVEKHPYRNLYRHVDFLRIDVREKVTVEVPIHFEGEPAGVREGGVLSETPRRVTPLQPAASAACAHQLASPPAAASPPAGACAGTAAAQALSSIEATTIMDIIRNRILRILTYSFNFV